MKVLVACEESGEVRDALLALGHDAMSCDLLPSRRPGPHYEGPVEDVIDYPWDMMIAFPPCTDIAGSGAKHFPHKRASGRQQAGISFVMRLWKADIPRIALENPVGVLSSIWRKPDQIIQPYDFGHRETKKTCIWLKGLPKLTPTTPRTREEIEAMRREPGFDRIHRMAPGPDRARDRSTTYPGIANAMADQWGRMTPLPLFNAGGA